MSMAILGRVLSVAFSELIININDTIVFPNDLEISILEESCYV